jgi:hypothetical protein
MRGDVLYRFYERNYALLQTFEPFRQGGRAFALISPKYMGTSELDLATGSVIAAESVSTAIAAEPVSAVGFCPVGFYVPDWWKTRKGTFVEFVQRGYARLSM